MRQFLMIFSFVFALCGCQKSSTQDGAAAPAAIQCSGLTESSTGLGIAEYCEPGTPSIESVVTPLTVQFGASSGPDGTNYSYLLNVATGVVTNSSGAQVYQLNSTESANLSVFMKGVYASIWSFNNPYPGGSAPFDCPAIIDATYATINTSQMSLVLNTGCGPDLYEFAAGQWQNGNFETFINNLESNL